MHGSLAQKPFAPGEDPDTAPSAACTSITHRMHHMPGLRSAASLKAADVSSMPTHTSLLAYSTMHSHPWSWSAA